MDSSDREDVMEEELANIVGVRRRERWERRLELERGDNDLEGVQERMDRLGARAAFRERVLAAHRRGAAAIFGQQDHVDIDDVDDDVEEIVVDALDLQEHVVAVPANANAGNGNFPHEREVRDHFFAMLEEWEDL